MKRIDGVLTALKISRIKNNNIHYEYDNTLPNEVIGDSLKISQILINLISNSIKFTENGDIWVRVKMLKMQKSGGTFWLKIQETVFQRKTEYHFESFLKAH